MNHRPALIAIIAASSFLFFSPLLAANDGVGPAGQNVLDFLGQTAERSGLTDNPDPAEAVSPTDIISTLVNVVLGLAGVAFFIQIFVAGMRWMMSEGNEETIKNSKAAIVSASIGLVIAFSAFIITNFVLNRLYNLNPPPAEPAAPAPAPPLPAPSPPPPSVAPEAASRVEKENRLREAGYADDFFETADEQELEWLVNNIDERWLEARENYALQALGYSQAVMAGWSQNERIFRLEEIEFRGGVANWRTGRVEFRDGTIINL